MSLRLPTASFALAISLLSSLASAAPKVLVFGTEDGPAPPGFVQALAIQSAGNLEVKAGGSVSGTVGDKLRSVEQPLRAEHAIVGIWVERSSDPSRGEFVVYVASKQHDRVLVQVVRLPGKDEPETDRALALKVSEVLDRVVAASGDVTTAVAEPEPSVPEEPGPRWQPLVLVGVAAASAGNGRSETAIGGLLGAGVRRTNGRFVAELTLELRPFLPVESESSTGTARLTELDAFLRAHALLSGGPLAAGIQLATGPRILQATGTAPDGRSGDATRVVPMVHFGPEARFALGEVVSLRLAFGLDVSLRRQRFSVLGGEVADLGSIRGSGDLSAIVAF